MVRKLFGIFAAIALASGAMFALVGPASGQQVNTLTVDKSVVGTAPSGTVFTVQVHCTGDGDTTLYFNAAGHSSSSNGTPISAPVINPDPTDTCTVTESVSGGASSIAYECELGAAHVGATCNSNNVVQYTNASGASATIVVTNTFEEPTTTTTTTTVAPTTTTVPPKPAPKPILAPARFTG
jgi:hypothetical protein